MFPSYIAVGAIGNSRLNTKRLAVFIAHEVTGDGTEIAAIKGV